jgi:hypothetical protein
MDEAVKNELSKLNMYEVICADALCQLHLNNPRQLAMFEKDKIISLLKRMFDAEREYLIDESDDYLEIYKEEI